MISVCIISAILLILSFPAFNIWLLAWFGFVPLFFSIENVSKSKAFLLSYLSGIIFWSGIIYWLIHVTLPGTVLLILYLALYFAIFGVIIKVYELRVTSYELLFIPSIWVLLEYIRSHLFTGFPWALLGYSQYLNLPVIQIADITGVWGVSFLVMMVNVMIWQIMKGLRIKGKGLSVNKKWIYLLPVLCILTTLVYGYYRLSPLPLNPYHSPLKISVIQGNIPQELKWDSDAKVYILDKYSKLTQKLVTLSPDLIIWPEASSPGILGEDELVFQEIFNLSKKIRIPLLIGAVSREDEKYFNSALLINGNGQIVGRYDKLHLVPFGEYIPLKKILPFLETVVPIGDITAGGEYTVFKIPNSATKIGGLANHFGEPRSLPHRQAGQLPTKFSVLVCFEDLFPELSREFIKRGANFLVNITNDAWYKKTSAAYQHLQASVFRAVENRVFLVRSANTGVSGFISPDGKIISKVSDRFGRNIFIDGYDTQEITILKHSPGFYTRYGDIFILLLFIFMLYGIFRFARK